MLSMTSGLPRSMATWVSQVIASVGATLVATMIYSALPHFTAPDGQPAPAMTSGGKFAARATGPASEIAYDGLDRMPLPQIDARDVPVAVPLASPPDVAEGRPEATLGRLVTPAPKYGLVSTPNLSFAPMVLPAVERPVKAARSAHAPLKAATRQAAPLPPVASAPSSPAVKVAEPDRRWDDGLVPKVLSTAQAAWSMTASAGGALVARVIPQLP